ncbi:MAG TPA: hydroxysqualene dehydroxylase HpnE [Rhodospirillales bacterium]|nr:hydroxysqualene dehydroxylase HpnE [Rhodospirillales bacterium]
MTIHVIGAGLSGLAAAVALVKAGHRVLVHEAAGHAGGRCRSYFDAALGRRIDNGNHLVLSGNTAIARYLADIGGTDGLSGPERAEFPFIDVVTGERWTVRPNAGPLPWWILAPSRRVPGTAPGDYLKALRIARVKPAATVAQCLNGNGQAFARFWEPLAVSVLNTEATTGAAALLWPVLRETFGRGEAACRPRMAALGLSECFIDPALRHLEGAGATVHFHRRLRRIAFDGPLASALHFAAGDAVPVGSSHAVVLAVLPQAAEALVPGLAVPQASRAIVNGHFLLPEPVERAGLLGLVGGLCHWLFLRGDVASVTISAADAIAEKEAGLLAEAMWTEIVCALDLGEVALPAHRIVKEKRATFAQTPAEVARRPAARTPFANLFLAGDWTDTGLPATLEGSVRSGNRAAEAVAKMSASP